MTFLISNESNCLESALVCAQWLGQGFILLLLLLFSILSANSAFWDLLLLLSCADQIMTSPAWLPPEVQQLTANASISGKPVGGSLVASSTPIAPTSNGSNTATNDSTSEPSQAKSVTAPGGVIPQSSFSFQNSEGSGRSASFVSASLSHFSHLWMVTYLILIQLILMFFNFAEMQVINSNPSVPPGVSSFSYSVSQTAVGYSPNQQFQPNMVRVDSC